MIDKLKAQARRVRVRVRALLLVLLVALPDILDALGVIDLKPILEPIFGAERAVRLTGLLAILLAFMRPMLHMMPKEDDE